MPTTAVQQVRALLAEKFPGMRTRIGEERAVGEQRWATGCAPVDRATGGLRPGTLTEIAGEKNAGSATLLRACLVRAAKENQIIALIDGSDTFDVSQMDEAMLARVFWVRCASAAEAMQAADLILRDSNFPFVLLDLKSNPETQLRKIPATTWYRLQRLIEKTSTVCVIFTPKARISAAEVRLTLPLCAEKV
jgi:hypothetical protein